MSSLLSYVWLSLKRGLGNYLRAEVLRRMGSPEAVYAADSTMLAQSCPSLRRQHIELLCDKSTDEAEQVITQCAREDIRILPVSDAAYPDRLRQIEDPPVVLYIRGRWPDFDTMPGIAVVGTRQATSYGVQVAGTIGAELAKAGFVTVSGMALGNDAAAHRGALRAGGLTVAVLAGGPDVCYPPQNRALMGDILLSGAVISEYPPGPSRTASTTRAATASSAVCASRRSSSRPEARARARSSPRVTRSTRAATFMRSPVRWARRSPESATPSSSGARPPC